MCDDLAGVSVFRMRCKNVKQQFVLTHVTNLFLFANSLKTDHDDLKLVIHNLPKCVQHGILDF